MGSEMCIRDREPVADDQRAAPDLEAHVGERRRARVFDEQRPPPRRVEVAVRVRRAPGRAVAERVQRVARFAADVDVAEDRVIVVFLLLYVRQGCCCWRAPVCNVTQLSVVVCRLRSAGTGCLLCTRSVDIVSPSAAKSAFSGWGQLAV